MTTIEQLRSAAEESSREPAIYAALGDDATAEHIAELLPQTTAEDKFLRIVLRNRLARDWPRTSDDYQNAVMFLAAERAAGGKRAYASEIGIPGNEYATLNDAVLQRQIRSPDVNHRIAAAQMMRPRHLHLIEKQLSLEEDDPAQVRLQKAGRRIAGEPGAPPSSLLKEADRLAQLVRLFGRGKGWLRRSTVTSCFNVNETMLVAAVADHPVIDSTSGHLFTAEGGRKPPFLVPEHVDGRETALRLAHSASLERVKELSSKHTLKLAVLWLRAQTPLWLPDLRYWLGIPAMATAFEGLLLRSGDAPLCVRDGKVMGDVDMNAMLVLQHPVDGLESPWREQAPKWQTIRPVFTREELPEVDDMPEIEFADWSKRTKALGYKGIREQRAVVHTMRWVGNVRIGHSGHGHGYGKGPQKIRSVSFPTRSAAAVSEVVWDIRRLLGIDHLKPKR